MWVKVIHHRAVPYVGQPGDVRKVDTASGKALILLGRVAPCEPPGAEPAEAPKVEVPKPAAKKAKKKTTKRSGSYKRRDASPKKRAVLTAEKRESDDA